MGKMREKWEGGGGGACIRLWGNDGTESYSFFQYDSVFDIGYVTRIGGKALKLHSCLNHNNEM